MIYIIHFDTKLSHAQHYCGFVEKKTDLDRRISEHRENRGARIMAAVNRSGISWSVVRTMPGGRPRERQIKNGHKISQYCPICRANKKQSI